MSSKRMTANPVKPARYRPGKAVAEEPSSEEEDASEVEEDETQAPPSAQPPKASSFPSDATTISRNLKKVDLNERRRQAAADESARLEAEKAARAAEEEGFVTEESEEEEGSDDLSGSGGESESEESSGEDETPKKLLRPTFIKKGQRKESTVAADTQDGEGTWEEEEAKRTAKADAMIQEQLEKDAAARAAGRKDWDDDELQDLEEVDDTDDIDPETERAAWKLRELKRVKREREVIEVAEKEREEIERRRNLSKEDREAEDKQFLEMQKEGREGKGKMGYMQKYFHKGAFFQSDAEAAGLDRRDIMGSRIQDDVVNRELLPEYMQIRDMTKLGRKSRTKYKDLKTEDTGKWGAFEGREKRADGTLDERFRPDREGSGRDASGANAAPVGERRRAPQGAPEGPRRAPSNRGGSFVPNVKEDRDDGRRRQRSYSRSRSPPRRRERSYSRSPPRRRERRRSYSYSRSPSPRRDRYRDEGRRKRSLSPYGDCYASNKRRKVDV